MRRARRWLTSSSARSRSCWLLAPTSYKERATATRLANSGSESSTSRRLHVCLKASNHASRAARSTTRPRSSASARISLPCASRRSRLAERPARGGNTWRTPSCAWDMPSVRKPPLSSGRFAAPKRSWGSGSCAAAMANWSWAAAPSNSATLPGSSVSARAPASASVSGPPSPALTGSATRRSSPLVFIFLRLSPICGGHYVRLAPASAVPVKRSGVPPTCATLEAQLRALRRPADPAAPASRRTGLSGNLGKSESARPVRSAQSVLWWPSK